VEINKEINSIFVVKLRREKREKIEKTAEDFIRESQREPDLFLAPTHTTETAKALPDFQIDGAGKPNCPILGGTASS